MNAHQRRKRRRRIERLQEATVVWIKSGLLSLGGASKIIPLISKEGKFLERRVIKVGRSG